MRKLLVSVALTAGLVTAPACSKNPATGRVQAFLISESDEIELGKKSDAEIVEAMPLYTENDAAVKLVEEIGRRIAKVTERPDLPWTFRVLDDPAVNAFALPGGYVYVTRGLLGHLNSADELAGVLGHECGHVTARHGAVQLRKQRTASRTVGIFRIVDPNLRHIGGLAASTAGLALLKYSRDDEFEADELALRYVERVGYDRAAIPEMFGVLAEIGKSAGRVPTWLSTHPEPDARRARIATQIGADGRDVADEAYLKVIDKITYGRDARNGYFVGTRFIHPRVNFQVDLPADWKAQHDGSNVIAILEQHDGLLLLGPADDPSAKEGLDTFFAEAQLARGEVWEGEIGGFHAVTAAFSASASDGTIMGLIAFIDFPGQVFVMIALSPQSVWAALAGPVANTFASFRKITDPKLAAVEPARIRVVKLDAQTTLADFNRAQPSVVTMAELALINHVAPDEPLAAGRWIKRVVGFNPELADADAVPGSGPTGDAPAAAPPAAAPPAAAPPAAAP